MSEEKVKEDLQDDSDVEITAEEDVVSEENSEEEVTEDPQKDLEKALAEAAELRDKMLRGAAENENFKKRVERERQASLKYAGEMIFKEMLSVVDNLERAVGQGVVEGVEPQKNLDALVEGVQLTLKSLVSTLEKFEVKPIESVGEPFDPKTHEALTMDKSDTVPANHVLTEFEKGYYYKDKLLRAAKVVVSSGDDKESE